MCAEGYVDVPLGVHCVLKILDNYLMETNLMEMAEMAYLGNRDKGRLVIMAYNVHCFVFAGGVPLMPMFLVGQQS